MVLLALCFNGVYMMVCFGYPSFVASMVSSLEYSFMTARAKRSERVAYCKPRNCRTPSFEERALIWPIDGWEKVLVLAILFAFNVGEERILPNIMPCIVLSLQSTCG